RVVGADLHALRAADAALEELLLGHRAGRADDAVIVVGVDDVGDARDREDRRAGRRGRDRRAAPGVRRHDRAPPARQEAELDYVLRAGALAVQAHVALVLPPLHAALRRVGALAVYEAEVTVGTLGVVLLHPEEREPREHAEERAERAEDAAPEAR